MGVPAAVTCSWLHISGLLTRQLVRYGFVFGSGFPASMSTWPGQGQALHETEPASLIACSRGLRAEFSTYELQEDSGWFIFLSSAPKIVLVTCKVLTKYLLISAPVSKYMNWKYTLGIWLQTPELAVSFMYQDLMRRGCKDSPALQALYVAFWVYQIIRAPVMRNGQNLEIHVNLTLGYEPQSSLR